MLCVHLGPGRLGLGLVVETLLALDLDVCLVGAYGRSPQSVHKHEITFVGDNADPQARRVRWVANPAGVADLDAEVLEGLRGHDPVLITGSLAHEAPARANLLRELLERRPPEAETVVLACENEADAMYGEVTARFPRVHYCACVVDRIVNWNDPMHHSDGRRRVIAHPVAQWVIWHPDPTSSKVIPRLQAAPAVVVVDDHRLLEGHRKRKQWAVNGVHLFMALILRNKGDDEMPIAVQDERFDELRALVMPLIATVMEAIRRAHPQLPYDQRFVADRLRVFRETPSSTIRVLQDRLVRTDLRALMKHFDSCIGGAAREAHKLGMPCGDFESVVDVLLDTFDRRTAWLDQWKPDDLDPLVDAEVVAAFQGIAAGWMDPSRAHIAAARLGRMLAVHRNEPPP